MNNACTTRTYGYNAATSRTALVAYNPGTGGACQTTTAASNTTWTYDTAERLTTAGNAYDSLGRATTVPAADTGNPGGGNLTASYHVTDLVCTITQDGRTTTYTLDAGGERIRGWTDAPPVRRVGRGGGDAGVASSDAGRSRGNWADRLVPRVD